MARSQKIQRDDDVQYLILFVVTRPNYQLTASLLEAAWRGTATTRCYCTFLHDRTHQLSARRPHYQLSTLPPLMDCSFNGLGSAYRRFLPVPPVI